MVRYVTTRWSLVLAASKDAAAAREALSWLCQAYWEPLCAHIRRRGFESNEAEDQAQDFLLSILKGGIIERAERGRGRFRSFLLTCLDHHLGHARERAAAKKRGGGIRHVGTEAAEAVGEAHRDFDRDWAGAILARAEDRLRRESGDTERLTALRPFLSKNGDAETYVALGSELKIGVGAVRVAVHRLRRRFADIVREEVAQTLDQPGEAEVDDEIGHLLAVLGQDGL